MRQKCATSLNCIAAFWYDMTQSLVQHLNSSTHINTQLLYAARVSEWAVFYVTASTV